MKKTSFNFVGYSLNHAGDAFRRYNPRTGRIFITKIVKWLNLMAHEVKKGKIGSKMNLNMNILCQKLIKVMMRFSIKLLNRNGESLEV